MISKINLETYNNFLDSLELRNREEFGDDEYAYEYEEENEIEDEEKIDLRNAFFEKVYYANFDLNKNIRSVSCVQKVNYQNDYYISYRFLENYIDFLITFVDSHYSDTEYTRELLSYLLKIYNNKIMIDKYDELEYSTIDNLFVYKKIMNPYGNIADFEKYKNNYISFDYNKCYFLPCDFNFDLNNIYNSYHKKEIKKIDISSFKYKILDRESLYNLIYDKKNYHYNIPVIENSGNVKFLGFHYFTANDITSYNNPKNLRYLCCFSKNNYLLGVLKVADYELGNNKYYLGINYIDVHHSFRNLGIAKSLYRYLNINYSPETFLISSDLSDMGQSCKLDNIRKSIVTNFKNFNNKKEAYEFVTEFLPTYDYLSDADNLRTFRLYNLLSKNNCLINENYSIEKVTFYDKYYLKVTFKDSCYYLRSDTIYDIKNKKYMFLRSKSNDYIPVKCFLDYIETLNECNFKNFLKYISTPINICFDLKRNPEFNKI